MSPTEYRPPRPPLVEPGQVEHHFADMTVTSAADVPLAILQAKLAKQHQWLPIDGDPAASVGSLVEANSTGPLRLGYGAWRDLLLGCQFINGQDELITAGGRTVKNVAGYDLTKFMVGHRGVFGKLVTITTRTYRRPTGALLARFEPTSSVLSKLLTTTTRPQWSILTVDSLLCGYLGDDATLVYWQSALAALEFLPKPLEVSRRTVDEDIAHRADLFSRPKSDRVAFRASVPPTKIIEFVDHAQPTTWAADAAFGIVIGTEGDADSHLAAAAKTCGGTVVYERHGNLDCIKPTDVSLEILRRLKHAFDPDGHLAPLPRMIE